MKVPAVLHIVTMTGLAVAALVLGPLSTMAQEAAGPWALGNIVVEQAWARIVPGARSGAVYLTIHNKSGQDDLLLAVDSPAATTTAVHESVVKDGVATMAPVPGGVSLPNHGELTMRPGSMHIMLTKVAGALEAGDTLPVKMVFRDAGSLEFDVPIVPLGSGDPTEKHQKH